MLKKKEIITIIGTIIVLALALNFFQALEIFPYTLASVFLIIAINITSKKIISYYLDSEIEIRLWHIKQYGFKPHHSFKRAFPTGVFFPIITSVISLGHLVWMAPLVFDSKAKIYRTAKRFASYKLSEMTEYHIALIASAGIIINIILAIVAYLVGVPEQMNFIKLSIVYIFFNLIPFSDLDGNKIYFGFNGLWIVLAVIAMIGMLGLILAA